ncbi:hypothetical protein ES708_32874 [subsurface metagenome]
MHKVQEVVAQKIQEGAQKQYATPAKDKEVSYSRIKFIGVKVSGGKVP